MTHPYPPRSEQSCGNCFYVQVFDAEVTADGFDRFECHRHAGRPVVGSQPDFDVYWPEVSRSEWCGEWAPQEVQR